MGDVIRKLETARFCRTLGTLLASGVPLLQALNNCQGGHQQPGHRRRRRCGHQGGQGGKGHFCSPCPGRAYFRHSALSMIKVGEETGQLDQMLIRIAVTYEKSLRQAVKRFMAFLEPVMILIMGLIIGFIVISMLLAIFSISELPF